MDPAEFERDLFRAVNAFVEPAVRAGLGSPCLVPFGLIVLETVGRRSGQTYRTPLLASLVDDCLIVATFRRRSHWVRNARSQPYVTFWLRGEPKQGRAWVLLPGEPHALPESLSPLVRGLAENVLARYTAFGWSFAIIEPGPLPPAPDSGS